jgi:hypothetical protein
MVTSRRGEVSFFIVPKQWIVRPAGYEMVGFHGTTDADGKVLRGAIDNNSCGEVNLAREE